MVDGVKCGRKVEERDMITFVILFHWWTDREYTGGLFQWNDVYSRQTSCSFLACTTRSA